MMRYPRQLTTLTICMAMFGTCVASAIGLSFLLNLLATPSEFESPGVVQPAHAQNTATAKPKSQSKAVPPTLPTAPAPSSALQMPPPETQLILIRSALTSLNLANASDNYQVLHAMCSPTVQQRFSPADLRSTFATLRTSGLDLSPILVLSPQLTGSSGVTSLGVLRLVGFFPTQPLRIMFALEFSATGGRWRIETISVVGEPVAVHAAQAPASTLPQPASPATALPTKDGARGLKAK